MHEGPAPDIRGVLSIGKLGKGQEAYYLDKVAAGAEDYYSGEGEVAGQWIGAAAGELGLEGEVGPEQLKAMLTGRNPVDGDPLLGRQGVPGTGSVPGFDLTFSAPKSVSLIWSLGGIHAAVEVNEAHQASVEAALDYMRARRAGRGVAREVRSSCRATATWPPPTSTDPRATATHSCTPTS